MSRVSRAFQHFWYKPTVTWCTDNKYVMSRLFGT